MNIHINRNFNSFHSSFKDLVSSNHNFNNFKILNPSMDENYYSDSNQSKEVAPDEYSRYPLRARY